MNRVKVRGGAPDATVVQLGLANGALAPAVVPCAAADVNEPAVNTAAVVNYGAAGAGVSHVITGVAWSYNAAPTGGRITIEDGAGVIVFRQDITAAGPGSILFPMPKRGAANTAMIVTLTAAGAAVTGKVSVLGHWTEPA